MSKSRQDKKLFFRINKKDKDAFLEAYDAYADDVHRFIYFKIGGREEEAKDLTSAVFLKVWSYAQSQGFDESKSLRAFIYRTARNSVIDYYRQNKIKTIDVGEAENSEIASSAQSPLDLAMAVSDLSLIRDCLPRLKDEYREIIIMRFVDELSFAEIAEITGKPSGNLRVLAFRALQALKDLMEEKNTPPKTLS